MTALDMEKQWAVDFHGEFLPEFRQFSEAVRRQTHSLIKMLKTFGLQLGRPQVDTLKGSKHASMKELCVDADGVWRVVFAFDLKRNAILLVGTDKSGVSQDKFYRNLIEVPDRRFDRHQRAIAREK